MKKVVMLIIIVFLTISCAKNNKTYSSNNTYLPIIEADGVMYTKQINSDSRIPIPGSIIITDNYFKFVSNSTITIQKKTEVKSFTIPIHSMKYVLLAGIPRNNQPSFEFYLGSDTHMIFSSSKSEEIVQILLRMTN